MENNIVLIAWRDSNRYIDQCHKDYEFEVVVIKTVGFLLSETDTQIVLAQDSMSGSAPEDYRGIIVIPKENIIKSYAMNKGYKIK
ncbi:MAG: hypothetical protein ACO3UU_01895 [Minisyncoccia bacterium]